MASSTTLEVLLVEENDKDIQLVQSLLNRNNSRNVIVKSARNIGEAENILIGGLCDMVLFSLSLGDADHVKFIKNLSTVNVYVAFLFLEQAEKWDYKRQIVRKFVSDLGPRVRMNREYALTSEPMALEPA